MIKKLDLDVLVGKFARLVPDNIISPIVIIIYIKDIITP
jgi:hypothetical protein